MLVRYSKVKFDAQKLLNDQSLNDFGFWSEFPKELPLKVDKNYVVFAIEGSFDGIERFHIVDESGRIFPTPYPSSLFEVIDERLSKYWPVKLDKYPIPSREFPFLISFAEWMLDPNFEEKMVENIDGAIELFKRKKDLMSLEFKDEAFGYSDRIDSEWLMCSKCSFVFQDQAGPEMSKCPKCLTIQNKSTVQ